MNKLLLLSPIILAACVQHQDPCVVHKLNNCGQTYSKECICENSRPDHTPNANPLPNDPDDPRDGNGGNSNGAGDTEDGNGGGSSVGSNDNNGSSSDGNGGGSDE